MKAHTRNGCVYKLLNIWKLCLAGCRVFKNRECMLNHHIVKSAIVFIWVSWNLKPFLCFPTSFLLSRFLVTLTNMHSHANVNINSHATYSHITNTHADTNTHSHKHTRASMLLHTHTLPLSSPPSLSLCYVLMLLPLILFNRRSALVNHLWQHNIPIRDHFTSN